MNAIKFTPKGGNVWINSELENTHCVISVRDDGVGITAELEPFLFSGAVKPQSGTSLEKGVGLGLLLCKEFVELQEGELTFTSGVGEGTTFSVVFPVISIVQLFKDKRRYNFILSFLTFCSSLASSNN